VFCNQYLQNRDNSPNPYGIRVCGHHQIEKLNFRIKNCLVDKPCGTIATRITTATFTQQKIRPSSYFFDPKKKF